MVGGEYIMIFRACINLKLFIVYFLKETRHVVEGIADPQEQLSLRRLLFTKTGSLQILISFF